MRQLLSEWHQSLQRVEANVKTKWCTVCSSNPLVPVNEVTSFYPSWATRGTDTFKWITVPRVHFSTGQDPHCSSRVTPKSKLASHHSFCQSNCDQRHTHTYLQGDGADVALFWNTRKHVSSQGVLRSVHTSFGLQVPSESNWIIPMGKTTFTSLYIICFVKISPNDTAASLLEGLNISARTAHGISQQRRYR